MTTEIQRAASGVKPTMTDQMVLDFCKTGIFTLEGIIPDVTNRWVTEYLDQEGATPNALVRNPRYIEEVLLHPEVAGAARSLLGENFQLPDWMANHRLAGPMPAKQWHVDGGSGFERLCNLLQVFYIPQTNTKEMGPTLFLPGSHIVPRCKGGTGSLRSLGGSNSNGCTGGVSVFYRLFDLASTIRKDRSIDAQPTQVGILANGSTQTGLGCGPQLRFCQCGLLLYEQLSLRSDAEVAIGVAGGGDVLLALWKEG